MICFTSLHKNISNFSKRETDGNGISWMGASKQTSLSRNTPSHRLTQRQTQARWARLQRPSLGLSLIPKSLVFINPSSLPKIPKQWIFDAQIEKGYERHHVSKVLKQELFGHVSWRPIIEAKKISMASMAKKADSPAMEVRNTCPPMFWTTYISCHRALDFSPSCIAIHH